MRILRISQTIFLVMAVTVVVRAQQVASKDLLRPPVALTATAQAQVVEKPEFPNGCSKMGVVTRMA